MTHGDKAKAKAGKPTQASGKKSSSALQNKAGDEVKAVKGKAAGKSSSEAGGKNGGENGGKKSGAGETGVQAGSAKAGASRRGAEVKSDSKSAKGSVPAPTSGGFANPLIADGFRRALEKYPNALRKLTD
jgi:hypothetical protein